MDTTVYCALMNYERGGLVKPPDTDLICHRGHWDFTGLHAAFSALPQAPALIGICEAKEWEMWGGQGLHFASRVLQRLFGRPYIGRMGWLPQGKSGPAVIYDPTVLHLDYWGDDNATVHWERRNLARFTLTGRPELQFDLLLDHFPFWSGDARLDRAKLVGKYATSPRRMLWMGDFNCTPSGEHWPQRDWTAPRMVDALDKGLLLPDGRLVADTRVMDYLIGHWEDDHRVGGIGFHAIPELAWQQGTAQEKALLPTVNDGIDAGGGLLIDFGLLNDAWRNGLVPDTFRIHVPTGTCRADYPSDHRLSAWLLDAAA